MAIEIVDFPINSMVDLSIVMWQFTRPGSLDRFTGQFGERPLTVESAIEQD